MMSYKIQLATDNPARRRVLSYWLVGLGLTVGFSFLHGYDWRGSVHLHTVMEAVATLLAATVGAMALVRYYSKKTSTFLFIGIGFLGTGFLDGYHAVVTSAFFKPYMPSDLPALIPWSWVASRQFLSIFLFLGWLAWLREQRLGEAGRISERSVYLFGACFTLASFLFFAFAPLPRAYYPELIFHRPEEFLPAIFFLVALVGYLRKGAWRHDAFEHWLVLSLVVGVVSQAVFMSFSGTLFDFEFDAAHTLKKVSYVCVLTGLMVSTYGIFRQADEANARLNTEVGERKRAEHELAIQARNLARSNADLERFASVAAHDLQEPLRKVLSFGDRLQSKYADVLDDQGRDYLARMQGAAGRMRGLIDDLLLFSRVSTQARPFAEVDLNKIAREVVTDMEIGIKEFGATIDFGELPTIDADPVQMRQLIQNLLGNALKYRREDTAPVIKVEAKIVENGLSAANGSRVELCQLSVADNGIGFEEKFAERIFGIFQRLHGRGTFEGTGVGLAICRKIAERHGGSIAASSGTGDGATFLVTLPMSQPKESERAA